MIFLQIVTMFISVFVIVMIYAAAIKMVKENREFHEKKKKVKTQDNLDLTNKQ